MPFYSIVDWEKEVTTIRRMGEEGKRMPEIANHYGVTRQRIEQVLKKYFPEWKTTYGAVIHRNKAAEAYQLKWGERQSTDLYNAQRIKFRAKKAIALRTGFSWGIEFGEISWPKVCPILGIELDYFAESCVEASPSFDRIDSNLGYDKGNVHIISWRANRIKNNGTAEEHRRIADYLDNLTIHTLPKQEIIVV